MKRYNSYEKVAKSKFVDLFETNNFAYYHFFRLPHIFGVKWNFLFLMFSTIKTKTTCPIKKWCGVNLYIFLWISLKQAILFFQDFVRISYILAGKLDFWFLEKRFLWINNNKSDNYFKSYRANKNLLIQF